jgi:glycosyltransferase involved in cell wall biosynthesis
MARRRVHLFPDPTENDLDYLINRAAVLLLPIAHGGGSNIKTAEALLTDRPIIGTSTAFRGYDKFRMSKGVTIKDDVGEFRRALRTALSTAASCNFKRENAELLLWERCVANIPSLMRSCIAQRLS